MESLGADVSKFRGKFRFFPDEGIERIKHNADSKPSLLFKGYTWNVSASNGKTVELEFLAKGYRAQKIAAREKVKAEKAAEQRRLEEKYVADLADYYNKVHAAREKSAFFYNSIKIENVNLRVSKRTKTWATYYVQPSFDVVNTSDHPLFLNRVLMYILNAKGKKVDSVLLAIGSGGETLQPGERISVKYDSPDKLYNASSHYKKELNGAGLDCIIFPKFVNLSKVGTLKADGSPFLPKKMPSAPMHMVYKYRSNVHEVDAATYKTFVEEGRIKPLNRASGSFPWPSKRYKIRFTASDKSKTPVASQQENKPQPAITADSKQPEVVAAEENVEVSLPASSDEDSQDSAEVKTVPVESKETTEETAPTEKEKSITLEDVNQGLKKVEGFLKSLPF